MSSNRLLKVGLSLGLGLLFSSMAYADDPTNIHTREAIDTREVITTPDTPVISTRKAVGPHSPHAAGGAGGGSIRFNQTPKPQVFKETANAKAGSSAMQDGITIKRHEEGFRRKESESNSEGGGRFSIKEFFSKFCRRNCEP